MEAKRIHIHKKKQKKHDKTWGEWIDGTKKKKNFFASCFLIKFEHCMDSILYK